MFKLNSLILATMFLMSGCSNETNFEKNSFIEIKDINIIPQNLSLLPGLKEIEEIY